MTPQTEELIMLRFSRDHLWVKLEPDGLALIGITSYGRSVFGHISGVELPSAGDELTQGDTFATVQGSNEPHNASLLKMMGRGPWGGHWDHVVHAPLTCQVDKTNESLSFVSAKLLNDEPEAAGWLAGVRIADLTEFESLLDHQAYDGFCETMEAMKIPLPTGWIND